MSVLPNGWAEEHVSAHARIQEALQTQVKVNGALLKQLEALEKRVAELESRPVTHVGFENRYPAQPILLGDCAEDSEK